MKNPLKKPDILKVETVARSRLFTVESVDLAFSNGARRVYERMKPSEREAVMIVPIIDNQVVLIQEYAVGLESYELGFPKGLIDPGETVFEAANRELKEEVGFGAEKLDFLSKLTMAPSYFSSKMNIVVAEGLYPERLEGDEPEASAVLQDVFVREGIRVLTGAELTKASYAEGRSCAGGGLRRGSRDATRPRVGVRAGHRAPRRTRGPPQKG